MRELKDDVLPPDEDPKSVKSKRSKKRSGTALPKYSCFREILFEAEAYPESCQTSYDGAFCENNLRLKAPLYILYWVWKTRL